MRRLRICLAIITSLLLTLSFLVVDSQVANAEGDYDWLRPGDILFAANAPVEDEEGGRYYPGFTWEHVAMYIGEGKVVESIAREFGSTRPGTHVITMDKFLKRWDIVEVKRLSGQPWHWSRRLQRTQVTRRQVIDAAIAYALKKAELKTPYNWKPNKFDDSSLYCSQLVWSAFMEVASINLDTNGGINVPPDDIYLSSWLHPVAWPEPAPSPEQNPD